MVWTVQTYETLFTGKTKGSSNENSRDTKTVSSVDEDHMKVMRVDEGRPCQEKKKRKKSRSERGMKRKKYCFDYGKETV